MNDADTPHAPTSPEDEPDDDLAAMIARARRRLGRPLPTVLNMPDGAYVAMALLAVAALAVKAWRPGALPNWVAILPASLLMAGFAVKCLAFGPLMLYEGYRRWRDDREDWP